MAGHMEVLTDWRAKRAGGRITVHGMDSTGEEVKVARVNVISVRDGRVIAEVEGGELIQLAIPGAA